MDFWNEHANKLETALQENASALMLHFLRTASPEDVMKLAGDALPKESGKVRSSVVSTLATRLAGLSGSEAVTCNH